MGGSSRVVVTIMTTKGIIITLYCYFSLVLTKPQYQETWTNLWKNAKTGDLLRSLDQITSTSKILTQPLLAEENTSIKKNFNNQQTFENALHRRVDEESEEILDKKEPYDYDKAYEEFVKKYFDDAVTDALSASVSNESEENDKYEAEPYSDEKIDSGEEEPIIEASTKTKNKEKCRNITRGKENCLICKNPRNGMTSESCSYNKKIKPQAFAFKKQKNFRKYRIQPKESEEVSAEDISAAQTSVLAKELKLQTPNKTNKTNTCMIKKLKNKTCYYCGNRKGEMITKCYAEEIPQDKKSNEQTKDKKKSPIQKSHQRIYKRTISYSYENTPHTSSTNTREAEVLENPLVHKQSFFNDDNENER